MKSRILSSLTALLLMVLLVSANVMAVPSPPDEDGYDFSTSMNYWKMEDLNPDQPNFEIVLEDAAYESAFGLYSVADITNPSNPNTFKVFDKGAEEDVQKKITFKKDESGTWYITDDPTPDDGASWTQFGSIFGFYYSVDVGDDDAVDDFYDYTFYTDSRLNSADEGLEHIYTGYDSQNNNTKVYLEDLLADNNIDWDWNDMTVKVNNVSPHPVPEPATMLMFGIGLIGFAFVTRRSLGFNKK